MQIIIPMSGFGERFRRAGYKLPKPLIAVEGKPIIAHVIEMFPGEKKFIFICNTDHLKDETFQLTNQIRKFCPTGEIVGIEPHKSGPIGAILKAKKFIDEKLPTIVNYCDFTCYWDWDLFKNFITQNEFDGVIPAYTGFHPHSLGNTNYAYLEHSDGIVTNIQEKQPFTDNKMDEYASSGTYYFSSGQLMFDAFHDTVSENLQVNGEFYVSMAYKYLFKHRKRTSIYPLQHFMQWGTPEDLEEYKSWSEAFKSLNNQKSEKTEPSGTLLMPMAGFGERFKNEGYEKVKPLIEVSGVPMGLQSAKASPASDTQCFIVREDMKEKVELQARFAEVFPEAVFRVLPNATDGQATTAFEGIKELERKIGEVSSHLNIASCDSMCIINYEKFYQEIDNVDVDVLVWCKRGHSAAVRHPHMFGWVDADSEGKVQSVLVKRPLSKPKTDPMIVGNFTFKKIEYFKSSVERMRSRNAKINEEFYIDECINDAVALGLKCVLFEVEQFISWGTPSELRTFEYWQSCFHKWSGHPYRLENDKTVQQSQIEHLEKQAKSFTHSIKP